LISKLTTALQKKLVENSLKYTRRKSMEKCVHAMSRALAIGFLTVSCSYDTAGPSTDPKKKELNSNEF
jgi:hypothetical protein